MGVPSSIYLLDTPCNDEALEKPTEVEVTDSFHPLFGRRFPLISSSSTVAGPGYVWVAYRDYMRLRIPFAATNLVASRSARAAKFSQEGIAELLALAKECEVLCPSNRRKSGPACPTKSVKKSQKKSRRSSRR